MESYLTALEELPELIASAKYRTWDLEFTAAALSALAASKGQYKVAQALLNFDDENVLDDFLAIF